MVQLLLLAAAGFGKPGDDLPQSEKALVDVDGFLLSEASRTGHARALRARQIDQLQLRNDLVIDGRVVSDLKDQREDAVAARGGVIQIVRGDDLVLHAFVEILDGVVGVIAFEDEQIFDGELLGLAPADPQALLLAVPLDLRCVQQVEDFLVIDLEEAAADVDVLVFDLGHLPEGLADRT